VIARTPSFLSAVRWDIIAAMRHRIIKTFTGPFALIQHDDGELATTWLSRETESLLAGSRSDSRLLPELADQLVRYFAGELVDFTDVATPKGSAFFRKCWQACRKIPRGQTISYAELAQRAGSPGAARAAGQAMRNNELPIIIPCHRVIGAGGRLHGFGGNCDSSSHELDIKRALLTMERAIEPVNDRSPSGLTHLKRRAVAV